ncbi:Poly [ADP-ribose] polymerase [Aphelenchoides bicaudatus]|nr:Poly [ADP-ribose] polymerase [Aphelenchoides bicaudatus]
MSSDNETPRDLPYGTDYAKSNRATCVVCKNKIDKGVLRMSVRVLSQHYDGMQDLWNHWDCFWTKSRKGLTEASIRGFEALQWDDQEKIREKISASETPVKPAKPVKAESKAKKRESVEPEPSSKSESVKLSVEYAKTDKGKCADCKEKAMNIFNDSAEDIQNFEYLEEDDQKQLKDIFKAPEPIDEPAPSKKARFVDPPERMEILKNQSQLLWNTTNLLRGRLSKMDIDLLMKANNTFMPRKCTLEQGLEFIADLIVFGSLPSCESCDQPMLRWNLDLRTYKCCSFISDYTRCPGFKRDPEREAFKVPKGMNLDFLAEYDEKKLIEGGRQYSLSVLNNEIVAHKEYERKVKQELEEENRRCIVKNGCTVDPKCEYAEECHVYIDDSKKPWQALLTAADLASGKNSFYKLQLLEHDHRNEYYVFRSWGRIGLKGGFKTEEFYGSLNEAKRNFEDLFQEKSQNDWYNVENYVKVPGGMELVEMDVDEKKIDSALDQLDPNNSKSSLPIQVREIISLFFNVKLMAKELAEFDLDTEKLPLAKLSKKQILRAHAILSDLSKVLDDPNPSATEILDYSNQFYTVMPHASGAKRLPLIDNTDLLKTKCDMLDSLLNLEIAYKMIEKKDEDSQEGVDVFDNHYLSLNCKIELLPSESPEAKLIQLYVQNGHMSTHRFTVKIKQIFKVERKDEAERYKKYKNLHNKQLLWHGSRTSNFAGILSKGLKIAPPEAPVNGYMFGKGIYLADCVSKSTQYCSTPGRSDAFLLLAEAALGAMQLEKHARSIVTPQSGYHSVKALGGTAPNDKEARMLGDVKVPVGKARDLSSDEHLSLRYNEYIVYSEDQVKLRYLIHADVSY